MITIMQENGDETTRFKPWQKMHGEANASRTASPFVYLKLEEK